MEERRNENPKTQSRELGIARLFVVFTNSLRPKQAGGKQAPLRMLSNSECGTPGATSMDGQIFSSVPAGPAPFGNPAVSPGCLGCGTAFNPLLRTSKYEEYRDLRNGFFIRKLDATYDNLRGSKNYVSLQSQRTIYRDQSYLATFGQYGKFKFQFRYDEIPHVYSNTTRTLFTNTGTGVVGISASAIRSPVQPRLALISLARCRHWPLCAARRGDRLQLYHAEHHSQGRDRSQGSYDLTPNST